MLKTCPTPLNKMTGASFILALRQRNMDAFESLDIESLLDQLVDSAATDSGSTARVGVNSADLIRGPDFDRGAVKCRPGEQCGMRLKTPRRSKSFADQLPVGCRLT